MCIPKSSKEQRIIENADVFDFQISPEDMHALVSDRVQCAICIHHVFDFAITLLF